MRLRRSGWSTGRLQPVRCACVPSLLLTALCSECGLHIDLVSLTVSLPTAWDLGDRNCLGLARAHRLLSPVVVGEILEEVSVAAVASTINKSHKVVVELATTSMDRVPCYNLAER